MKKWIGMLVAFLVIVALPSLIVGGKMVGKSLPAIAWGIGIAFVVGLVLAWRFRGSGAGRAEMPDRQAASGRR